MGLRHKKLPVVAIVGRPNVGKSSLFNRLVRRRIAIVHDTPGVTRDKHYATVEWNGKEFLLVDTGGFLVNPRTELELGVVRLVRDAVDEADVVLFLVEPEIHPDDFAVADVLRKSNKPVVVAVNKVDDRQDSWSGAEAEGFGLGDVLRISAKYGHGTGELLDAVCGLLPAVRAPEDDEEVVRVAVIGRPNVGKSSFVNRLLGHEVSLVHPEPGTTRDTVNARFRYFGKLYEIVDTAGVLKKQKDIEYFSALRTLQAIEECDVALLVTDATVGFTNQDKRLAALVLDRYRGLVIAVNKWDLVPGKTSKSTKEYEEMIRFEAPFLHFVPIVFTSALTGQRVRKAMEIIHRVGETLRKRVQTSKLNEFVQHLQTQHPPPVYRGRRPKILYAVQADVAPPEFVFFAKMPNAISPAYRRYIANQMRKRFSFEGVPFKLVFRDKRR